MLVPELRFRNAFDGTCIPCQIGPLALEAPYYPPSGLTNGLAKHWNAPYEVDSSPDQRFQVSLK